MSLQKCLHISDTHGFHNQLRIEDDKYDYIFITGDVTNSKDTKKNKEELDSFLSFIVNVKVKKEIIMVPGNHDVSIERLNLKNYVESFGVRCLIHEEYVIENKISNTTFKIFGTPYTPTHGENWAYMRDRNKLSEYWKDIPDNTDMLLVHGPPKGVLDLSYRQEDNHIERCGDKSLLNRLNELKQCRYILFGHIHDCKDIQNYGVLRRNRREFINSALVKDGRFDLGLIHQGNEIYAFF